MNDIEQDRVSVEMKIRDRNFRAVHLQPSFTENCHEDSDGNVNGSDIKRIVRQKAGDAMVYRSSMVFDADDVKNRGIKTIIDLRRRKAKPIVSSVYSPLRSTSPKLQMESSTRTYHVPLVSHKASLKLVSQLPWSMLLQLLLKMASYPITIPLEFLALKISSLRALWSGVKIKTVEEEIVSHYFSSSELLAQLYLTLIENSKAEVKAVFELLSHRKNYPVLIHCVVGKDRTGIIIALLSELLASVDETGSGSLSEDQAKKSRAKIVADYAHSADNLHELITLLTSLSGQQDSLQGGMKTQEAVKDEKDFVRNASCALQLSPEKIRALSNFVTPLSIQSPPNTMMKLLAMLDEKYGSVEKFLVHYVGLSTEATGRIKEIFHPSQGS